VFGAACPHASDPNRTHSRQLLRIILPSKMGSSEMEITEQEILAHPRGIAGMGRIMRDWNHAFSDCIIESLTH
jgi:hypothetical protein